MIISNRCTVDKSQRSVWVYYTLVCSENSAVLEQNLRSPCSPANKPPPELMALLKRCDSFGVICTWGTIITLSLEQHPSWELKKQKSLIKIIPWISVTTAVHHKTTHTPLLLLRLLKKENLKAQAGDQETRKSNRSGLTCSGMIAYRLVNCSLFGWMVCGSPSSGWNTSFMVKHLIAWIVLSKLIFYLFLIGSKHWR